jgi:hypothetical protein
LLDKYYPHMYDNVLEINDNSYYNFPGQFFRLLSTIEIRMILEDGKHCKKGAANWLDQLGIGLFRHRMWRDDGRTLLTRRPAYVGQENRQQTE